MANQMPIHYKDLRDELDEILGYFNVPRILFYQLNALRMYLSSDVTLNFDFDHTEPAKVCRALEIIDEIIPKDRRKDEIYEETIL